MPTKIDIEPALLRWQAKHKRRLTYEELAKLANIPIAALYRLKSGEMIAPDLRRINNLCKALECTPGELIVRENTENIEGTAAEAKAEQQRILLEIERKVKKKSVSSNT
jgi:DNA-binding Xre family transcriptional regulator